MSTGNKSLLPNSVKFYELDICDVNNLNKVFTLEKPDYVLHLAAQVDVKTSITNPIYDAQKNILGTLSVLECCVKNDVKKIIYSSSCAIYGDVGDISIKENTPANPSSFYGLSKYTPEQYVKLYSKLFGLSYTILRYANVYGPRQSTTAEGGVISIFINKMRNGEKPTIYGDGEQTRDFVFVVDVANANFLALEKGCNEVINISCNRSYSINHLYTVLGSIIPSPGNPIYQPTRNGELRFSRLNNDKAKEILSWNPDFSLVEGLKQTVHEIKQ